MKRGAATDPFRHGIDLFNQRAFFECHEVLEDIWRPERGPRRLFLQGVIHFAVAFHHNQCGNPDGAERQLRKGLKKVAGYLPEFDGVNTARLYRDGVACLETILRGEKLKTFPKITRFRAPAKSPRPARR